MDKKYYTLSQANAMLPEIKHRLARIKQMRTQARIISQYLAQAGYAPEEENFEIMA